METGPRFSRLILKTGELTEPKSHGFQFNLGCAFKKGCYKKGIIHIPIKKKMVSIILFRERGLKALSYLAALKGGGGGAIRAIHPQTCNRMW